MAKTAEDGLTKMTSNEILRGGGEGDLSQRVRGRIISM